MDTLRLSAASADHDRGPSDARLVAQVARGDPHAAACFIETHQDRVAALARRLLAWRDDIEDVVQDVFVAALEHAGQFRGESQVSTWLFRITVNRCRKEQRRRWLRLLSRRSTAPEPAPAARAMQSEADERVRAAVASLPQTLREVVVLRYLEELPILGVALILGLERNAVEVRLNRARQRLKDALAPLLEESADAR